MTEICALAPKPAFVGGLNPAVVAMLGSFDLSPGVRWFLWAVVIFIVWIVVGAVAWYLLLEYFDKRSSYERWLDRKQEDADQKEYLEQWQKKKNAKKSRGKKR